MKKILFIAGTRPEAIKLSPLYLEMRRRPQFQPVFCATGQHTDMTLDVLDVFGITPEITLNTMKPEQTLPELLSALFQQIGAAISRQQPDLVIVQGDTASAYAGAWTAFLRQVDVLHVEAGLRTHNLQHPFPEEAHRRAISIVARYHAAPTEAAQENLLKEGVSPENVIVTGNTVIDALFTARQKLAASHDGISHDSAKTHRKILVTCHRRENHGRGIENICSAVARIAREHPDAEIILVRHPNPAANTPAQENLESIDNIKLVPPFGFMDFIRAMTESYFIISDSGGIQEEAPALGRPVLVTRQVTERPEAVEAGSNRLVGTEADAIFAAAHELLTDPEAYNRMANGGSPYGDGQASLRICDMLEKVMSQPPLRN